MSKLFADMIRAASPEADRLGRVTRFCSKTTDGARVPYPLVNGAITPNYPKRSAFVVSRGGAPDIDPDKHRLVVYGLVNRPLVSARCVKLRGSIDLEVSGRLA